MTALGAGAQRRYAISATDAGTGVSEVLVSTGGAFEPYEGPFTAPAGATTLRAFATDGAGNRSPMTEVAPERVFIGSCTNARIEDLREAAEMVEGRKVADSVRAMVVPGSQQVKAAAEAEGPGQELQGDQGREPPGGATRRRASAQYRPRYAGDRDDRDQDAHPADHRRASR